jgi:predicted nucleic acid-binding protein
LTTSGKSLAPLKMMIAARALQLDAILVANDAAFARVRGLRL